VIDLDMIAQKLDSLGVENVHVSRGEVRSSCPLHGGENPTSFSVSPEGKSYCFGCLEGYGSFDALIRKLSKEAGVPFESFETNIDHLYDYLDEHHEMVLEPLRWEIMGRYIRDDDHFVRSWGISYSVVARHNLRIDPNNHHELFPIVDHGANFWGFVERWKGIKRSVYRYPKDLDKKKILLGQGVIEDEGYRGPVWVVEGVRDLCAIETKIDGARAVALGGARLSDEQSRYLMRFESVIAATDNDEAGIRALMQFEEKIPPSQLLFAQYPGKDPAACKGTFKLRHPIFGV
jgi:DNA primase